MNVISTFCIKWLNFSWISLINETKTRYSLFYRLFFSTISKIYNICQRYMQTFFELSKYIKSRLFWITQICFEKCKIFTTLKATINFVFVRKFLKSNVFEKRSIYVKRFQFFWFHYRLQSIRYREESIVSREINLDKTFKENWKRMS